MMKYTVNIIDTEEKFREKFGSDPKWIISTPQGKQQNRSVKNITNDSEPERRSLKK